MRHIIKWEKIAAPISYYDLNLFIKKVSDNEYFDLENCVMHPIDENGNDWNVNKLDNVEISVSI